MAMNIVDDFDRVLRGSEFPGVDLGSFDESSYVQPNASDLPLLSVDTAVKQTAR